MIKFSLILSITIILNACTTISDSVSGKAQSKAPIEQVSCLLSFAALDTLALKYSGTLVGNRLAAMPWLRHNRLITHDIAVQRNDQSINGLLQQMSSLAKQGLLLEIAMVPVSQIGRWQKQYQISVPVREFVQQCTAQLTNLQRKTPQKTLAKLKAIPPDNDYSNLARVAGLYPLATIPFRLGVINEQRQLAKGWGRVGDKRWFKYQPPPRLHGAATSQDLLSRHAPTWLVNSSTPANLLGSPFWQGEQLKVNAQATTYAFVSEARWKQQPVTQLNYIIWFAERPSLKRLDWVAGQHDAVVFRVNLDQQGEVIAYDSIHLCGCWYRLFLPKSRPFSRSSHYWREPVLMQRVRLPAKSSSRMAIYLQADTHQIQYVVPAAEMVAADHLIVATKNYQLQPFSKLLKLPVKSGVRAVFNNKGYVAGSERPERWLFWPMGVNNPGALRRFGDHAISFVGRRYFDDPRLLEKVSGLKPFSSHAKQ